MVRQIINWKTITEAITGIIYGLVSPLQSLLAYCNLQHENHDVVCQIGNLTLPVDKPIGPSVRIPRELSRTFHHSLKKELSGKHVVEFVNLSSHLVMGGNEWEDIKILTIQRLRHCGPRDQWWLITISHYPKCTTYPCLSLFQVLWMVTIAEWMVGKCNGYCQCLDRDLHDSDWTCCFRTLSPQRSCHQKKLKRP
jgi:hypothetical protein